MEINTLSQKIIYDMLIDKKLEYKELGFCLTVIRDNCSCDNTCEYLDLLIKNIEKNF
mgnify:CR=1 FL=1